MRRPRVAGLKEHSDRNLSKARLDQIRGDIAERSGRHVQYVAPWLDQNVVEPASMDWLSSHSVLEHVDELAQNSACFANWLRPGAVMSHLIDCYSHGITPAWNGHWALDANRWKLVRGRRPYLLNRAPRSELIGSLRDQRFLVVHELIERRSDGLLIENFAPPYRDMPAEDARTRMSFLVATS